VTRKARSHAAPATAPPSRAAANAPALPPWKAFVVQFSQETTAQGDPFAGRVEHLNSGRRAGFKSPEELLAVLRRLLRQANGGQP
jgi:hypothetical protein